MRISYFASILKSYSILKNINKITARQSSRTILGDKITPLTENTLLGRMLLYLNNSVNKVPDNSLQDGTNVINNLIHGKTNSLRSLNVDQIAALFYNVNTNILSHNKQNLRKVLNLLDVECCFRINTMKPESILKLLNAFMHVTPNRITDYKFYHYATDNIDRCLKDISKKELLQFIFYIGLQKQTKKAQVMLRKCLRNINRELLDKLSIEDLCIVCNSTYRTNTKISNAHLLDKIKRTLNDNLNLMKDPALFVTLLKTVKQNHYEDEDLLSTISCTIFFNNTAQYYTFTTICYILSLYADYLYYDEELLNLLIQRGIEQLKASGEVATKNMYLTEQLRAKDITILLWAVSSLGYTKIDIKTLKDVFLPKIKERISIGEYKSSPDILIDAVLYMWMLNYRAIEILPLVLTKENTENVRESQSKSRHHLNLLLTCIAYEEPELYKNLRIKSTGIPNFNPNQQIQNRPLLQRVLKNLKALAPISMVQQVETNCQIPYFNILGISGYDDKMNKVVNIEVLDEFVCVKNKDCHPSGLMQLKLRLLEQVQVPLIIINQGEIDSMTDLELHEFLEEEIKLVSN
ncbi:hypothetical protein ILUMI_05463 [Ignelater luminosus]|uniref:RAP domain-containing protein n=1 Tax=Ignelater luminosus TaxID=2038154 RepID=A0A8K0DBV9_IGNLU|nr:hypothetical protein ILUMI_05463 [Ignelater luminosus]